MRQILVLSIIACSLLVSVQSASFYVRTGREAELAAVPEIVKEAVVAELKKDEIPVIIETEVEPVEPNRNIQPVNEVPEPIAIVSDVKQVDAVVDPDSELRQNENNDGTTTSRPNLFQQWNSQVQEWTQNYIQNFPLFRPAAQQQVNANQAVQSDSTTNRPGGIFGWFNNNNNNNRPASNTNEQQQNQNPLQSALANIQTSLGDFFSNVNNFVRPAQASNDVNKVKPSAPVSLSDDAAPVEEEIIEVKSNPVPAVDEEPKNTV